MPAASELCVISMNRSIAVIGFWSALLAFLSIFSYCIVQLLQVGRIILFPLDEILIYGTSLLIVIPFLLAMVALHHVTPAGKRFYTHASLVFAILYAVFVTANYVVQLATVVPMKMKGLDPGLLAQTPHSMFWDFDALGYIFMGITCFVLVPVFEKSGFQKWVRWSLLANALVTPLISVVYFYPVYSENLLLLGYPWAITAPLSMLMLAVYFRKRENLGSVK